ncbi:hypothetical protein [Pseudoxanthomonas sp. 10H]
MDTRELELPDPCLEACHLLQESWQAAGLSTGTDARHAPPADPRA